MLEMDEATLKSINSSIDEAIRISNEKKDIRKTLASLGNVTNKVRAMAELREIPDNRFVSVVLNILYGTVAAMFGERDEEWFESNKDLCDNCLTQTKILLNGLKSGIGKKSFEETVNVLKAFLFAAWPLLQQLRQA